MNILLTGVAGFIGYHVANAVITKGHSVIGLDNLSPYYDVKLKESRLAALGSKITFYQMDIANSGNLQQISEAHEIDLIIHLAAQAGVRHSIKDPFAYAHSNLIGQLQILEFARNLPRKIPLIYASSSSVYGDNKKLPFSVHDMTATPLSFYAATKQAGESMAYSYAHLYGIPTIGLRFFTVYGPWGRPDMAMFIFTKAIVEQTPIKLFNHGKMRRNFTYVDDIVAGIMNIVEKGVPNGHRLYNLGNNKSVDLTDFLHILEESIGQKTIVELEPLQPGDVPDTLADISDIQKDFGFFPKTDVQEGIKNFVKWYTEYYGL